MCAPKLQCWRNFVLNRTHKTRNKCMYAIALLMMIMTIIIMITTRRGDSTKRVCGYTFLCMYVGIYHHCCLVIYLSIRKNVPMYIYLHTRGRSSTSSSLQKRFVMRDRYEYSIVAANEREKERNRRAISINEPSRNNNDKAVDHIFMLPVVRSE